MVAAIIAKAIELTHSPKGDLGCKLLFSIYGVSVM
jgi:hypothetical protein